MDRDGLVAAFGRDGVDTASITTSEQIELALLFTELYERHGRIRNGTALPPWEGCPHGEGCWRAAWDALPTDGPEAGGISLPWIGPGYRPGGVVVVGMNFNDASGFTRAYEIAAEDADELAAGRRKVNYGYSYAEYRGSDFPYRSTRSAALLADYLDGVPVVDREDPREVAPFVNRILRLQAVKCSPRNDEWSRPTDDMWENSPPLLLGDELRLARPGAIIGFGRDVEWVFGQLAEFEVSIQADRLQVGALSLRESAIPVYLVAHPRSSRWSEAHAALAASLRERQASGKVLKTLGSGRDPPKLVTAPETARALDHCAAERVGASRSVHLLSCESPQFRYLDDWMTALPGAAEAVVDTHINKWWSSRRPSQIRAGDTAVLVATKSGKVMGAFEVIGDPVKDRSHPRAPGKWPWTVHLRPLILLDGELAPRLRDLGLTAPHKCARINDQTTAAQLLRAIHPSL